MVRQGIGAMLDSTEFNPVDIDEDHLGAWVSAGGRVVLCIDTELDVELVVDLRQESQDAVLITIAETTDLACAALRAGANASIPVEADAHGVVLALRAADAQLTLLPQQLGMELASRSETESSIDLTDAEVGWLTMLSTGATVAKVADEAGYSSREMFRLLGACYKKLGAETRIGALIRAARLNLI